MISKIQRRNVLLYSALVTSWYMIIPFSLSQIFLTGIFLAKVVDTISAKSKNALQLRFFIFNIVLKLFPASMDTFKCLVN